MGANPWLSQPTYLQPQSGLNNVADRSTFVADDQK